MFEVGTYITCKEEESFRFGKTTHDGAYEVIKKDIFITESGLTTTECNAEEPGAKPAFLVRVVKHNTIPSCVGSVIYLEKDQEVFFEDISDEIGNEIRDRAAECKSWKLNGNYDYTQELHPAINNLLDEIRQYFSSVSNYSQELTNNLMIPLFLNYGLVNKEDKTLEFRRSLYFDAINTFGVPGKYGSIASRITERENYSAITNMLFYVDDVEAPEKALEYLSNAEYKEVEVPGELLLTCFSYEHKMRVFHYNNGSKTNIIYFTNSKTAESINIAAIMMYKILGVELPEAVRNAILESDKEAYFKNVFVGELEYIEEKRRILKERELKEFSEGIKRISINPLIKEEKMLTRYIDEHSKSLAEKIRKRKAVQERIFYRTHNVDDGGGNEIEELIKSMGNRAVTARIVGDNLLVFDIITTMAIWDEELFEIFRKSDVPRKSLPDEFKQLIDDIFLTREIKLIVEQKFSINLDRTESCANGENFDTASGEGLTGMPNPHITSYNCWGDNRSYIDRAVAEGNYIGALTQAISCISGITWSDASVVNRFMSDYLKNVNYYKLPCLQIVETGEIITIKEYIDKYKADGRKYKEEN